MNIQQILFGIIFAVLLVVSSYAQTLEYNQTTPLIINNTTNQITTMMPVTTPQITTTRATSDQTTATLVVTTASSGTSPATNVTTGPTSTKSVSTTTTKPSGRKFDGLSFIGGMILAAGLAGILFLVVSYLRRGNRLPYSNLR